MSSVGEDNSLPDLPPDSPGSSVSTRLMDEYEELLKYAVVVPHLESRNVPHHFQERVCDIFPPPTKETLVKVDRESDVESDVTPVLVQVTRELPDLSQSTIHSKLSESGLETPRAFQTEDTARSQSGVPPPLFQSGTMSDHTQSVQNSYNEEHHVEETSYHLTLDHDTSNMEQLLDQWTSDLKRNVLAEFGQSRLRIVEQTRKQRMKESEKYACDKNKLQNEIESLKELLHTYEQSIQRKDQVISNLTHALQKQKEKQEITKSFCEWKNKHYDQKREAFTSKLAYIHHERCLKRKIWNSWHSVIENKWRARVEKACQAKAQEICMQLTEEYESKLKSLNEALQESQKEISRLHTERERYEEAMKKAFMRGVCALNLEAMTMFHPGEGQVQDSDGNLPSTSGEFCDNMESSLPEKDHGVAKIIPQEPVFYSSPADKLPTPRVVTSQGARPSSSSVPQSRTVIASKPSSQSKTKSATVRVTSKIDSGRSGSSLGGGPGVAPPMSSVVVERHQPVNKQTIGQATAKKYTKKTSYLAEHQQMPPTIGTLNQQGSSVMHKKLAGQMGSSTITPHVQTVKVVD